jgi:YgiT-type zinc finger domain-containing protein
VTGKFDNRCYFCRGKLSPGLATLPFVVGSSVVIIKQVPAEVCTQCSEAIMDSEVAGVVDTLLKQAQQSGFEVAIATFEQGALAPV